MPSARAFPVVFLSLLLTFLFVACTPSTEPGIQNTPETEQAAPTESPPAEAPPPTEAAQPTETPDPAPELTTVKVVNLPFISFAPFYIALEEGFFADQGLEIEFVDMVQQNIVPALASGQLDVSAGLLSAGVLNTIAQGGQINIVADKGTIAPEACANFAVVARSSLLQSEDTTDPEVLRGLNVNVLRATWIEYYLHEALATVGLSTSDLNYVEVPIPAQIDALGEGTLDLVVQNEPWITRFKAAGHEPILAPAEELLPGSLSAMTLYGPSLLGENSEVGERFMVAYLQGVRQYNEGKTERNIEILAKHIQLEPELLETMCWPTLRSDGLIDVESVLEFQEWAQAAGYVEDPVSEEQFWDARFVEHANEVLGPAE